VSRRNSLWFAGLSLVVVSAAAATHADAQVRPRSERIHRRSGKQQPAAAPHTDTVTVTRSDTVRVRDTVFVDRPLPAPPPVHDTVRLAPPPPPVRTAYFGVQGGVAFPLSRTKDVTTVGPSLYGSLGFNAPRGPLGLRIDGGYQLLRGQNIGAGYSAHTGTANQARPDLAIYSGTLNGVIRARFTKDTMPGDYGSFYIFGGGGVAHVRSFLQTNQTGSTVSSTGVGEIEQNLTRPLVNGGAGLEVGGLGSAKLFVEGRFVYIFTPGQKITYVPVGLGVRF